MRDEARGPAHNPASLSFDKDDGFVKIGDVVISEGSPLSELADSLSGFFDRRQDHTNGYEWLYLKGLDLRGYQCSLGLCFFRGKLVSVHWGIGLPNAELEGGWPTRKSIDEEISVTRGILSEIFDRSFRRGEERFDWGVVWSVFDAKGVQASSGLRYET